MSEAEFLKMISLTNFRQPNKERVQVGFLIYVYCPKMGHKQAVQTQMDTAVHNISSHATLSHDVTSGSDIMPCNKKK